MIFLIPILAGYIAMSIGDRPALMPGMVAGLMASRGAGFIGGLIYRYWNWIIYGSRNGGRNGATNCYCNFCSLFKNKFTEKEKETKITNFILGLSFITEGAIPFAASEPQTVIPSVAIGSAIAGALVGAFDVQSPAPHGGVFVLPAMGSINQALFFLLAVAVGSIIGALILGNLKKKPEEKYDNI